jgi:hypothetical protein
MRLAVMTAGLAGLFVAVNTVPGAACGVQIIRHGPTGGLSHS